MKSSRVRGGWLDSGTHEELIRALHRRSRIGIIAGAVVSVVTAFVFHVAGAGARGIPVWLAAALFVCLLRYILCQRWLLAGGDPRHGELLHAAGTLLWGIVWGVIPWLVMEELSSEARPLVPMIVLGMMAGSTPSNAAGRYSVPAFLFPSGLSLSLSMTWEGEPVTALVGLLVVIYTLMMYAMGRRIRVDLLEHIDLVTNNRRLAENLKERNALLEGEIMERERLLEQIRADRQLIEAAFDQSNVCMALISRDFRFFRVNEAGRRMLGVNEDQISGLPVSVVTHPDDREISEKLFRDMIEKKIDRYRLRKRYIDGDGKLLWADLSVSAIRDEEGEFDYAIGQAIDITEQVLLEQEMEHASLHDPLTGLPNRKAFNKALDDLVADRRRKDAVICFLDLDQFKVVNDTCGHPAGDELLIQISGLIRERLREDDLLARLGGDEFGLILSGCDESGAGRVLDGLLDAIGQWRFSRDGKEFRVGASIGAVYFGPGESVVAEDLLARADEACYESKERGKHCYSFHAERGDKRGNPGLMRRIPQINEALSGNLFELFRQPVCRLSPDNGIAGVVGHEVLLRMRQGDVLLMPGQFMPSAERYGLSPHVDLWVVTRALELMSLDPDEAEMISVNLSGLTLGNKQFLEQIVQVIRENPDHGSRIGFEITETAAIRNLDVTLEFMARLMDQGCRFWLDDFGSGLSSFGYLRKMPVTAVKVDGEFIRGISRGPVRRAMVRAIREVTGTMDIGMVAEFVEDEETLAVLSEIGVGMVQGFHVGSPMPWRGVGDP